MKTFLKIMTTVLIAASSFLVMGAVGNYEEDLISTSSFFLFFLVGTAGAFFGWYILDQLIEDNFDWEEEFEDEDEFEEEFFDEDSYEDSLLAQVLYFEEEKKKNSRRRSS